MSGTQCLSYLDGVMEQQIWCKCLAAGFTERVMVLLMSSSALFLSLLHLLLALSKQAIVEGLLKEYPNVLTLRVRMPIVPDMTYPRNFITKIIKYDKVSEPGRQCNGRASMPR